jgi:kanamycin nucleotidyltransferase
MDHEERMTLAQTVCDRFVGQYTDDVIVGGVYGSAAKGSDTDWSDLEMLFVVKDGCKAQGKQFLYCGIAVSYGVLKRRQLEKILKHPCLEGDTGWPFFMGVLSVLKILHGDRAQVDSWLQMGNSVPYVEFKKALEKELPGLITESYGRILSCKARNNMDDWYCAVLEVVFEMRDALCLLNKSWTTHDYYQGLVDTFKFQKLPKRYKKLVPLLWHVKGIDTAITLVSELKENFQKLLAEEGIKSIEYADGSDIPV